MVDTLTQPPGTYLEPITGNGNALESLYPKLNCNFKKRQYFNWRPPVLAILAFFWTIWLFPENVRLETLQLHTKNCKQKSDCEKILEKIDFYHFYND